jgi:endonuclease G
MQLDRLDESLEDAVRRGAEISPDLKAAAMDATRQIIDKRPLSLQQKAVLESIVLGNGLRPAFDVQQDSFDLLPSAWSDVNEARTELTAIIRSIGRLNVQGHPKLSYAGTAFVCGDNLLLTNRHVAEEFMDECNAGVQFTFKPGMCANIDLKQEVGSDETKILEPTGDALVSREWDVALLPVKSLPANVTSLRLASNAPSAPKDRTAVVIGYPAFDEKENLVEQILIFRGAFNKKRLQPGKFIGFESVSSYGRNVLALAHDCTTLGGNSGSALIDIETRTVWGVHFGGVAPDANYSVPTWELLGISAFSSNVGKMSFV